MSGLFLFTSYKISISKILNLFFKKDKKRREQIRKYERIGSFCACVFKYYSWAQCSRLFFSLLPVTKKRKNKYNNYINVKNVLFFCFLLFFLFLVFSRRERSLPAVLCGFSSLIRPPGNSWVSWLRHYTATLPQTETTRHNGVCCFSSWNRVRGLLACILDALVSLSLRLEQGGLATVGRQPVTEVDLQ